MGIGFTELVIILGIAVLCFGGLAVMGIAIYFAARGGKKR